MIFLYSTLLPQKLELPHSRETVPFSQALQRTTFMILQVRATAPAPDGGSPVQPDCGTARQPQQQGQHFYNIYMNDSSKNIQG